jgi:hypothetical protein
VCTLRRRPRGRRSDPAKCRMDCFRASEPRIGASGSEGGASQCTADRVGGGAPRAGAQFQNGSSRSGHYGSSIHVLLRSALELPRIESPDRRPCAAPGSRRIGGPAVYLGLQSEGRLLALVATPTHSSGHSGAEFPPLESWRSAPALTEVTVATPGTKSEQCRNGSSLPSRV